MSALCHKRTLNDYSITSSARPISVFGTLSPSALAVFRFMYSVTFLARWTGRSPGLSPLSIRLLYFPAKRYASAMSDP